MVCTPAKRKNATVALTYASPEEQLSPLRAERAHALASDLEYLLDTSTEAGFDPTRTPSSETNEVAAVAAVASAAAAAATTEAASTILATTSADRDGEGDGHCGGDGWMRHNRPQHRHI